MNYLGDEFALRLENNDEEADDGGDADDFGGDEDEEPLVPEEDYDKEDFESGLDEDFSEKD